VGLFDFYPPSDNRRPWALSILLARRRKLNGLNAFTPTQAIKNGFLSWFPSLAAPARPEVDSSAPTVTLCDASKSNWVQRRERRHPGIDFTPVQSSGGESHRAEEMEKLYEDLEEKVGPTIASETVHDQRMCGLDLPLILPDPDRSRFFYLDR
jgi:hypothetical protein